RFQARAGAGSQAFTGGSVPLRMDYTWPSANFPARKAQYMIARKKWRIRLSVALSLVALAGGAQGQQSALSPAAANPEKKGSDGHAVLPAELFAARAQLVLGSGQPSKGDWGLLVADAKTGEVLFEQNADRYFVPASNMKLFTTALALAKLGA